MEKKLEIGKIYRIKWKGIFGFKHIYFGELTDIKEKGFIFDNNLYLELKDIIWIQKFNSKNELYKIVNKI